MFNEESAKTLSKTDDKSTEDARLYDQINDGVNTFNYRSHAP